MKRLRVFFLLLLFLTLNSPLNAQTSNEKGPMRSAARILVFVRLANGSAAPAGIPVRLNADPGGLMDEQMTDSGGKVTFIPKVFTTYVVIVHYDGYQDAEKHVDLSHTPTAAAMIELHPIPRDQGAGSKTGQDIQGLTSVQALGIPEAARKEFEQGQRLFEERHDASASIDHFQKATKLYDQFQQAYLMLGLAYLQSGKQKDSQAALERAVELDPNSAAAYLTLGACLNQQKEYPGAEKALLRGLELAPESPEGHYELAKSYWAQRRWQEAEPHALKAETLAPNIAGVHVVIGNILLQKRDNAGALKEFNEYLRLDPKGSMSDAVRAMVTKLEKAQAATN